MPTAMPASNATRGASLIAKAPQSQPAALALVFGKVMAVAILLAPLAMRFIPELNHRSGTTASGGKRSTTVRQDVVRGDSGWRHSDRLVPFAADGSDQ
jgi:hypothetical protein